MLNKTIENNSQEVVNGTPVKVVSWAKLIAFTEARDGIKSKLVESDGGEAKMFAIIREDIEISEFYYTDDEDNDPITLKAMDGTPISDKDKFSFLIFADDLEEGNQMCTQAIENMFQTYSGLLTEQETKQLIALAE